MHSKADAEAVRTQNRRLVLEHVRRSGVSTRRRMSAETGLSLSSTSSIASDMVRSGILSETGGFDAPARRGRPEVSLELSRHRATVAAVKIAVGEIAVTIADYSGAILGTARRDIGLSRLSEAELVEAVLSLLNGEASRLPAAAGPLRQVVVSVQGVTDAGDRCILWSPILGLRGVDLATPIEAATGARTRVLNDCGIMPERFLWEDGFGSRDFATLFIGFGVGMGLRLGGKTFRGSRSSAVEFGHLNHVPNGDRCRCGNLGCVEAYAGDYAIWRAARGPGSARPERRMPDEDMKGLAEAARAGEPAARAAYERAGEAIGYGLGRLFALIDPLPVVFLGSGAEAMDLLEPAIRRSIGESAIDGVGGDAVFQVVADVDAVTVQAAAMLALSAVDDELANAPNAPQGMNGTA